MTNQPSPSDSPIILCDNLVKIYKIADLEVVALQGLDLEVDPGEIMALVGPSGAGKSTLLNVIGGLDVPSAGEVHAAGHDLLKMKTKDRVAYKRESVGFVWQQPGRNLLPYLTARENVEMPMMLAGLSGRKRRQRAMELLEMVALTDRANFRPDRLSGGQQQRVALAVALANNPALLLGDELTGQVDGESAREVFLALKRINQRYNTTIIIVTHDPMVANVVDRVVAIRDGRTSTEIRRQRMGGMVSEEEWVIVDRAGRLQLPAAFVEQLNLKERAKVRLEPDHVAIWPSQEKLRSVLAPQTSLKEHHTLTSENGSDEPQGATVTVDEMWRTFILGAEEIHAVNDVSMEIPPGTVAVLKGRSGSGKTTLLNLIAGLDEPTEGRVLFNQRDLARMSSSERINLRRKHIGFVYQTFGLLPFLSAGENVEVPLRMVRAPGRVRRERVKAMLDLVGLVPRMKHRTYELSGGEQQRVAIARALVNRPDLLLADEPTGQLDTTTGASIINLLREIAKQTGVTVIIASHDPNVHAAADVVYELEDGMLVGTVLGSKWSESY